MSNFATPWTAACQVSLSITNSWSLLKLMSIELVMPSNHLILCHPLLLLPSVFPIIRVFSNESTLHFRWPKYWSFSIRLISFRIDWLYLLAVQGTLKSLLQHQHTGPGRQLQWQQPNPVPGGGPKAKIPARISSVQFSSVQSLSRVRLFATL